jgi:hypothetical protein
MREILLHILIIAYGAVGIVGFVAYWPTIKDLYKYKKPSANIASYVLWTITAGITFLYSLFVLPDPLFIFVSGMYLTANALVLFLSLRLRSKL